MMTGFERYTKKTRRAIFLEEMEPVVPWAKLCALIEPHYPKPGNGRRPKELEKMLRIYACGSGSIWRTRRWKRPCTTRRPCDSSRGLIWERSRRRMRPRYCKFRLVGREHHLGRMLGTVNLHFREGAPRAQDYTQRRCRYQGQSVDEVAWAKNQTKSKVRAKVEHVFQVMKLKFGFVKVRYRRLKKNAHRLFVTCALVHLFVSRNKLLLAA